MHLHQKNPGKPHFYFGHEGVNIIKRPARDACLCMGELPAPPALPAPHFVFLITLTVRRILFKFGRFRQ